MRLHNIRLKYLLPIALVAICLGLQGTMGWLGYKRAHDALIRQQLDELGHEARGRSIQLSAWLDQMMTSARFTASAPTVGDALRVLSGALARSTAGAAPSALSGVGLDNAGAYGRALDKYAPYFAEVTTALHLSGLYLLDDDGTALVRPGSGGARADAGALPPALQDAVARSRDTGEPMLSTGPQADGLAPQIYLAAPVPGRQGAVAGHLVLQMPAARLDQLFPALGEATILVLDGAGMRLIGQGAAPDMEAGPVEGHGEDGGADARVYGWARMEAAPHWSVVVLRPRDMVLQTATDLKQDAQWFGLVTLALSALLGGLLARYLLRPLRRLVDSMGRIATGACETSVHDADRRDEIGDMARALEEVREARRTAAEIMAEGRFKGAALENTTAALMITDADFNVIYLNGSISALMTRLRNDFSRVVEDFSPEGLIGTNMDRFHGDPGRIRALVDHPSKLPFRTDIPIGTARLQIDVSPVWHDDGTLAGLVIEWVDVTAERRNQAILQAIEAHQVKAEFDTEGRLRASNRNFQGLIGGDSAAVARRPLSDWIVPHDAEATGEILSRLHRGEAVHGRFTLERGDGPPRTIEGNLSPIRNRAGRPDGIVLIASDVTEAQQILSSADDARRRMQEDQNHVFDALRMGLRKMSDGDLSVRLNEVFSHEYEPLRRDFNEALQRLGDAMRDIAIEAQAMQQETGEISGAASEMSVRTERQAMTLQHTAARLDEVTRHIVSSAEGAGRANSVVADARDRAERSGHVVDEAEGAMAEIARSSREVVKVVQVIDDIAFQTSLLALNAGVEAARAGEAGRGFAVVATEVRALAQRCSNAAAEIGALITSSGTHVDRGVSLVGQAGEALKAIVSSISEISLYIGEVARAGADQSRGLAEVNTAVLEIDQVTQQNAAMFEETSSAAQALAERSHGLSRTTGHFRFDETFTLAGKGARPTGMREVG